MGIYENLGLPRPSGFILTEGWHRIAIFKLERNKTSAYEKDLDLIIHYQIDGSKFVSKQFLNGNFSRNSDNTISGAGGAFVVLDLLEYINLQHAVNINGLIEEELSKFNGVIEKETDDGQPIYQVNVLAYMYRHQSKDGKSYWRFYRQLLPLDATAKDKHFVETSIEKAIKDGYLSIDRASENSNQSNESEASQAQNPSANLPGF